MLLRLDFLFVAQVASSLAPHHVIWFCTVYMMTSDGIWVGFAESLSLFHSLVEPQPRHVLERKIEFFKK
jgi:hypothetical protein